MSKKEPAPSDLADKFMLRLPDGMRERIKLAAEANNRSMNAEIVATLEEKYPAPSKANYTYVSIDKVNEALKNLTKMNQAFKDANKFNETLYSIEKMNKAFANIGKMDEAFKKIENMNEILSNLGKLGFVEGKKNDKE